MTTSFDNLVNDVLRTLSGFGLVQDRQSVLGDAITDSDLQISVADATGFEQGVVEIGTEQVFVISVDYGSNVLTVAQGGRGYYGTTAVAHDEGDRRYCCPVLTRNRGRQAVDVRPVRTAVLALDDPVVIGVESVRPVAIADRVDGLQRPLRARRGRRRRKRPPNAPAKSKRAWRAS